MDFTNIEMLLLAILASGVLIYLFTKINKSLGSALTIVVSLLTFLVITYFGYNNELTTTVTYLPLVSFNVTNLGLFFAIIVSFIFSMVSFFNPLYIKKLKYPALYNSFYIFVLGFVVALFLANDFLTLFIMFELVVWISMFLIPLGKSKSSTVLYFVVSTIGSFALLFAILIMYKASGVFTIDAALASVSGTQALLVYSLMILASLAKLGAFPLHIWLPKVLGKSVDPVTTVFSGGLEKLGAFVAVLAIAKVATASVYVDTIALPLQNYVLALIGGITIVMGTLMAIRQDDAKKLLAWSSASNGGYILVALTIGNYVAFSGAMYHVLSHALATAAAFLAISVVARRTGTTKMSELGGMIHHMPITYMVYLIAIISLAGIPPMGGFISKWLIYQAIINKGLVFLAVAAFFGSIGSFLYVFRPLAALFLGQKFKKHEGLKEANLLELIPMIILSLIIVYTGIFPNFILGFINNISTDLGYGALTLTNNFLTGFNGDLNPAYIALVFGVGVLVVFILFMIFPKSRKVKLMDTYTAANFIYNEETYHYSTDFYAPFERLYAKHPSMMKLYEKFVRKIKEFGDFIVYLFFGRKPETAILWIVVVLILVLWGGKLW